MGALPKIAIAVGFMLALAGGFQPPHSASRPEAQAADHPSSVHRRRAADL